ncbi:SRPBCC domain-containing protein [Luteolibacter marinus]|uniref:SRPBCC domain-containing protein n=1 Tax=Luteolibacter marinus TaxID=2776705 RepID=UPI0018667C28|nr:SRPBCC domain-containing protein [Luteolibacter marinus]
MRHELTITRDIDVPREKLFRCWTEVGLFDRWFCPRPCHSRNTVLEPWIGGRFETELVGPQGELYSNVAVFLDVIPNKRLVWSDSFRGGDEPSPGLCYLGIVTFKDLGDGRTRYTARARHWTRGARDKHLALGFEEGAAKSLDQLEEVAGAL